jgi:hypothetical protein
VKEYLKDKAWQKDPLFDKFSAKWQEDSISKVLSKDNPNLTEEDKRTLEAWEDAKQRKELAKQGIYEIDMPIDKAEKHWRKVTVQIKDNYCLIDTKKYSWTEIQKIQGRLTDRPPDGQPTYSWHGPDTPNAGITIGYGNPKMFVRPVCKWSKPERS